MSKSTADKSVDTKRAYGGVTAIERQQLRKERFINAGLDLIGSVGYRGMTLRVLCKAAGLNDRYFYESFTNLEHYLKSLYLHHMDHVQGQIETLSLQAKGPLSQRVRQGIHLYFLLMSDKRLAKLVLTEILGVSDDIDATYNAATARIGIMLADMLKQEFPSLKLESDALRTLGLSLTGACAMAATHWMLENYQTPIDVLTQTCTDIYLGTLSQVLLRAS